MAEQAKKSNNLIYVHYAVVLFFCFGFKYLPPIGALTPLGMSIMGTFIGCIYGWSLINMLWPSLVGLLGLGLTLGMDTLVAQAFGNQTVLVLIFMSVVIAVTTETGAMDWLGLVLICFVLPAVLTWAFGLFFRKIGWIREGDLKL